ncbi:hypothetical protein EJ05DRAFT_129596 [Pseudovirgaria hyperparasitica]|uniref:BZIP domain-containing protein n=1 Tax=Pseudovirgaria hyperparasitica TaxID=470096 RepID=A0A6A6VXZ0_9PEZI|nr:uncharacterized protein EJ05DRAFT_129596 [Pseudovirgaria hyperparasitica]KAF2754676.1 hypothetical protein EJ05DRAFT_129596 [Pseudovirgaria hyperparasitica]
MSYFDFDDLVQPSPAAAASPSILPSPSTQNTFGYGIAVPGPSGPLGATYKIPPRPKPGRKPATDEPQTKRKAQNREAQRNFRQRKAQRLTELEGEREQKDREHQEETEHLQSQIESLNQELALLTENEQNAQRQLQEALANLRRAEDERDHYRSLYESSNTPSLRAGYRNEVSTPGSLAGASASSPAFGLTPVTNSAMSVDNRSKSILSGCDDCEPERGNCACINAFADPVNLEAPLSPMSDVKMKDVDERSNYDDREIDFTTQQAGQDKRPSVAFITEQSMDGCGFCTDESNCVCAAEAKISIEQTTRTLPPMRTRPPRAQMSSADSTQQRRAPGTCPDCQKNPRQQEWCKSVSRDAQSPASSHTIQSPSQATNPANRYSVGCTDAFHIFNNRVPMASTNERMDWTSDLETLPPGASRKIYFSHLHGENKEAPPPQDRKYTAVEIDSASILTALTRHDRRHSSDKKTDQVLQKTVRFLEELPQQTTHDRHGREDGHSSNSRSSIGHILN